jgi:hypothetical protein
VDAHGPVEVNRKIFEAAGEAIDVFIGNDPGSQARTALGCALRKKAAGVPPRWPAGLRPRPEEPGKRPTRPDDSRPHGRPETPARGQ